MDLIETRKKYERSSRKRRKVKVIPIDVDGVSCEWLVPKAAPIDRVILYFHGGAWFMGSINSNRSMVSRLAFKSYSPALNVEYRLAPENPFPKGFDDCITSYRWLLKQGFDPKKIIIAGDSAGGNLTLATLIKLRDSGEPLPGGVVVISPATDISGELSRKEGSSYQTRAERDIYFSSIVKKPESNPFSRIIQAYITTHDPKHPYISPYHADLKGLPKLLMHVGDEEILLDDTLAFAEKARSAGVIVTEVVWPRMWHVFHMLTPYVPEANHALTLMADFIREVQSE